MEDHFSFLIIGDLKVPAVNLPGCSFCCLNRFLLSMLRLNDRDVSWECFWSC